MSDSLPEFIQDFNDLVKEVEVFLFIARDSGLQKEATDKIKAKLVELEAEKTKAIDSNNEEYANLLLGCECVANSLFNEIEMCLHLKEEKPEKAWDFLVSAQKAAIDATRAHDGFRHLEHHNRRLEAIEKLVFPPQAFISSGMIVHKQECSICGCDYDDCEHLIGKPYMGKFCYIIARDIELDHVSIVETPADKCCRVVRFEVEGGSRNRMTWKIEKADENT